jgi:FtsH-binding integral membrane protein
MTSSPDASSSIPPSRRRFALACVSLALIPLGVVLWALTLDISVLQRTALPMWLAMAVGVALALYAAGGDRRLRTSIVAALTVVWVLSSIPGYLIFTRLPDPAGLAAIDQVAEFTLPDQAGDPTTLSDLLREQSVLLVFYRGYW